jgi:uncharacterized protein YecT (DUF1311 family)
MRTIVLPTALLAACSLVHANDALYTAQYSSCMDRSGGVTYEVLDCIAEELKTQDARLNGAYQKLRSPLSAERKKALLTAQRLWIQYRDANCAFYNDPEGGTLQRVLANECMLRETAERAKELETLSDGMR